MRRARYRQEKESLRAESVLMRAARSIRARRVTIYPRRAFRVIYCILFTRFGSEPVNVGGTCGGRRKTGPRAARRGGACRIVRGRVL